ncbi:serine/threonine-protein phosphatase 7 long form homolog [Gastrolobium bilobum]|uniref:serine/threonine-protein phosphatase 7 long form homolog n=1 Tax=Gastrolobium bilobum TaxID=150636 RepID=UPI002AAF20DF|nr:serine/threonine-protein phosphatase 7 long form homolog [Gastrolobium bilobum]
MFHRLCGTRRRFACARLDAVGCRGPSHDDIPDIVADYLSQVGFLHVARMRHIQINPMLISALVKWWRLETHTFHMTQGEITITLQDVAAILGLPTDGRVDVFGHALVEVELPFGDVKLSYLDRLYLYWGAAAAHHEQVKFFTKVHIARMLGSWLLCDRSVGSVVACRYIELLAGDFGEIRQYSWGSAVLAHLFRELCELIDPHRSDMDGCHIILQIWVWLRFSPIAPPLPQPTYPEWHYGHRFNGLARFKPQQQLLYRGTLDTLCRDEVVWQPYGDYHF